MKFAHSPAHGPLRAATRVAESSSKAACNRIDRGGSAIRQEVGERARPRRFSCRKEDRVRIERGLYRSGSVYFACATPMGTRKVARKKLGPVGLMEARRLRDELVQGL